MKITSKIVTLILLIVFFVGLCVLLYPSVSQYWNSRVQSQAIVDYDAMVDSLSDEDYAKLLTPAYKYNADLFSLENPLVNYPSLPEYSSIMDTTDTGIIGYIIIDKLQVELPIYHGTSSFVLNKAAGHLEGTSLPVGGASTHAVLSAHRGLPSARLFTDLDKMQVGDLFMIKVLNQTLTYQVDQIKIVTPDVTTDLKIEEGKDLVTLLTCTPYGINSHRLLVRGHRIETTEARDYFVTSDAYLIDKLIVTPVVALPILFVLIAYVIFKPVKKKVKIKIEDEDDD